MGVFKKRNGHGGANHEIRANAEPAIPPAQLIYRSDGFLSDLQARYGPLWGSYKAASLLYIPIIRLRHRDGMGRLWIGEDSDRYLSPVDGRITNLAVQSVNEIYNGATDSTWRRRQIKDVGPWIVRVAQWPGYRELNRRRAKWSNEEKMAVGLLWIPTCTVLLTIVSSRSSLAMTRFC